MKLELIQKIGIFGGTFDPIHLGHTILAQKIMDDFSLDEMILIPAKIPPHKNIEHTTAEQRFDMVKLTAEHLGDKFIASNFELKSEGVSYSYNTMLHFRQLYPKAQLFFIAGSDIFATIESWEKWEELFELTNFIVVNRAGTSFDEMLKIIPEQLLSRVVKFGEKITANAGKIVLYSMKHILVSSTEFRNKRDKSMLLNEVYSYIIENDLYLDKAGDVMDSLTMANKIRDIIDAKLGEDIVCLDLRGVSSVTDFLMIATGKAETHVKAISENLIEEMKKKEHMRPLATEGVTSGSWSCVDYGEVIVHIMRQTERSLYNLQAIWGGAPQV